MSLVADVGTAASVRVAVSVRSPVAVPPSGVARPGDVVPVPPGDAEVALGVPVWPLDAPAAPEEERVLPLAGRLDDVPELRWVVVLVVGWEAGFGLTTAGGRVLGGLPAPNAQPSTLPGFGRTPAPEVL